MRSWRQFATECDISYVQMRKLAQAAQENPPRPKLIQKIAANAFNDVDPEDLLFAAGMGAPELSRTPLVKQPSDSVYDQYRSLSAKDRRTVSDFIEFLASKSQTNKSEE